MGDIDTADFLIGILRLAAGFLMSELGIAVLFAAGIGLMAWAILRPEPVLSNEPAIGLSPPKANNSQGQDLRDALQSVISEIEYIHFGWLWKDDPYILFGIVVSNASLYDIEITGVKGSANINDTSCTRDARVPSGYGALVVPSLTLRCSLSFYQPLQEVHARTIQTRLSAGEPILFDLSPTDWVATVTLPTGKVPFPQRFACAGQFEVDGNRISPEHSQANVQPTRLAGTGPEVVRK
jgi:hypothetical protein